AVLIAAVGVLGQSQGFFFWNWKMNAAKAKYSPGPAPKSNNAKWETSPGGGKLTVGVGAAPGETQPWESRGKVDGKDNPVKGNNPDADTIAFSKTDARTYEIVQKKGGKTTLTGHIVVAADGKTRITTNTGKDGQGQTVNNTMLYEKQGRPSGKEGAKQNKHAGALVRQVESADSPSMNSLHFDEVSEMYPDSWQSTRRDQHPQLAPVLHAARRELASDLGRLAFRPRARA